MVNNLFQYATKELSQDAFVCWLCSHTHEKSESDDVALRECAEEMICSFMGIEKGSDITLIEIRKQFRNVDILLSFFNCGKRYGMIVEDK